MDEEKKDLQFIKCAIDEFKKTTNILIKQGIAHTTILDGLLLYYLSILKEVMGSPDNWELKAIKIFIDALQGVREKDNE